MISHESNWKMVKLKNVFEGIERMLAPNSFFWYLVNVVGKIREILKA